MWVAAVTEQYNAVTFADPIRDGVAVADFPVETLFGLSQDRADIRIEVFDDLAHLVHVARLEPRLLDIFGVLVRQNPVEFLTAAQCVLYDVYIIADPEVDTLLSNVGRGHVRIVPEVSCFEEGAEARITLRLVFSLSKTFSPPHKR